MYKLEFYVPETHLESVKTALFERGAGKIGDYAGCCWQVLGEGQYRPGDGSHPFVGEQGKVERAAEYKVEMVCEDEHLSTVIKALKLAHPYETPAYAVWRIEE